jgi:hypothetical protein
VVTDGEGGDWIHDDAVPDRLHGYQLVVLTRHERLVTIIGYVLGRVVAGVHAVADAADVETVGSDELLDVAHAHGALRGDL